MPFYAYSRLPTPYKNNPGADFPAPGLCVIWGLLHDGQLDLGGCVGFCGFVAVFASFKAVLVHDVMPFISIQKQDNQS